jgi:hypothetical protein
LLRVWYTDDNAIVRQKLLIMGAKRIVPLLTEIIRQGIQEGVLTTSYPDQVGKVVLSLGQGLGDIVGQSLLSFEPEHDDLQGIERIVAVYTDALERVLGAPTGSLTLVDSQTLKEWFSSSRDSVEGQSTMEQ